MNTDETLISIRDLSFAYGDREVLSHINLDVAERTVLGIVGPNGGGKTTLLKILLGLLKGYSGEFTIRCTYDPRGKKIRHSCLGYVPQKSTINLRYTATIHDAVEMGLYGIIGIRGPSRDERDYIDWLLQHTGISGIRNHSISEVSGGQLQRALIARALVTKPALLLMDEPLTGIDRAGVLQFVELLMNLKNLLNLTVVLVSHDFQALALCSNRVACLNRSIHYHENPANLTVEEISQVYSCSFEAFHAVEESIRSRQAELNA